MPVAEDAKFETISSNDEDNSKHLALNDMIGDGMLTDDVINGFMQLMKHCFPNVLGLQDTLLGQKRQFDILKNNEFVQVLHTGSMLWISISTLGCKTGEVNVFDSLYSGINLHTRIQICDIILCEEDILKLNVRPVQQQTGGVDCGAFAIANITSEILGVDLSNVDLNQENLRAHMRDCLRIRQVTASPVLIKRLAGAKNNQ